MKNILYYDCRTFSTKTKEYSLTSVSTIFVAFSINCSLVCKETQMFRSFKEGTLGIRDKKKRNVKEH